MMLQAGQSVLKVATSYSQQKQSKEKMQHRRPCYPSSTVEVTAL